MQKSIKKVLAFLMTLAVAVSVITTGSVTSLAATTPAVSGKVHVQTLKDMTGTVSGGIFEAGTTGKAKRLEAIYLNVEGDKDLGIKYRTHIQSYGWETKWAENGAKSGTSGEAKRLEAIQIELTGKNASKYDVYYRVHAQSYGWLGWAKNGEPAGTAGQAKRLESIQVQILPKGTLPKTGCISGAFVDLGKKASMKAAGIVNYTTHVQTYSDQAEVCDGSISGTFGEAKRLEAIKVRLDKSKLSIPGLDGGITYRTHVQSYAWQNWVKDGAQSGTTGKAKRLEAIEIKLYGAVANYYDVYYRVHAQSYGWLAWAKNGESAGTAGSAKRLEAIQIVVVPKGTEAPNALPSKATKAFESKTQAPAKATAEVKATGITLQVADTMVIGATETAVATVAGATNCRVVYASSDDSIATVDATTGKVTALKAGTVTITATTTDGSNKKATAKVVVAPALTKILTEKMTLNKGAQASAAKNITFVPADAADKSVTYVSSNPKIATVDANGNIKAIARGIAQITVTSKANAKIKNMIEVTVKDEVVTKVEILNSEATLTFSNVNVADFEKAIADCKGQLDALVGENWTATCGEDAYEASYNGEKMTFKKNGEVVEDIVAATAGKTMTLTAPVSADKANKVFTAAEKVQNASAYAEKGTSVNVGVTLEKTNAYTISNIKVDSFYSTATIDSKPYEVFFEDGCMYVVGDVTNDTFFKNMANDGVAKLTLK